MKKINLLLLLILGGLFTMKATLITVDNMPGSAADYSNLATAITAASNGDTILVYGSAYSYGNITVDKRLTIIGSAGFDPEVSNEANPLLNVISLNNGSDSTIISGFHIGYITTNNGHTVNRIGIYNNYFSSTTTGIRWYNSSSTDWVIEGNIFQAYNQNNFIENYNNNSTLNNILIKNNYFETQYLRYYVSKYNNSAFTYRNNVFVLRNNSGSEMCLSCSSVLFENNIFWMTNSGHTAIAQSCSNCVFNNNIIYNSGGGTMIAIDSTGNGASGNNNIINQDPQFVNFVEGNNYTIAENYRLTNASPGHNTGTDGMDIGLYGGNYNWENRKYPKTFPHQEILNVINNSVPQGTPVNINIKARKAGN